MPFIQGNISSNEDLIEVVEAMANMLTRGDYSAELTLELMLVKNKLDKLSEDPMMGENVYTHVGILYALKNYLEETLRELEEADKGPQEIGYDDFDEDDDGLYDEEDDEPIQSDAKQEYKKFLELYLEKAYGVPKPQEVEEEEPAELTSEEYLEEILEKINARTQANISKLHNNPWGL